MRKTWTIFCIVYSWEETRIKSIFLTQSIVHSNMANIFWLCVCFSFWFSDYFLFWNTFILKCCWILRDNTIVIYKKDIFDHLSVRYSRSESWNDNGLSDFILIRRRVNSTLFEKQHFSFLKLNKFNQELWKSNFF